MRALRLVYNDYDLSLVKLLKKDVSFTVRDYNIPAIEMFKLYSNPFETIFGDFFYHTRKYVWLIYLDLTQFGTVLILSSILDQSFEICFPQQLNIQPNYEISRVEFINGSLRKFPADL